MKPAPERRYGFLEMLHLLSVYMIMLLFPFAKVSCVFDTCCCHSRSCLNALCTSADVFVSLHLQFVAGFVRAMWALGYTVKGKSSGPQLRAQLRKQATGLEEGKAAHEQMLQKRVTELRWFKQGLLNAFLFSVARFVTFTPPAGM